LGTVGARTLHEHDQLSAKQLGKRKGGNATTNPVDMDSTPAAIAQW
jgi:hypothetical protein